jgi:hypothetical protein
MNTPTNKTYEDLQWEFASWIIGSIVLWAWALGGLLWINEGGLATAISITCFFVFASLAAYCMNKFAKVAARMNIPQRRAR